MKQYLALQAIKNALITIVLFGLFMEHAVFNRAKNISTRRNKPCTESGAACISPETIYGLSI